MRIVVSREGVSPPEVVEYCYKIKKYAYDYKMTLVIASHPSRVTCWECRCPVPLGHYAFREEPHVADGHAAVGEYVFVCFECLEIEYLAAYPEHSAPASADMFRDKGRA